MPPTRKRRADALTQDADDSQSASPQPPRRRHRSASTASSSVSSAEESSPDTQSTSTLDTLVKKLVRLALSAEYSRTPLRRADISSRILTEAHSRQFKPVFAGAQKILRETFGMELVELPSREKTSLKDRRTQATQNALRKEKETQDTQLRAPNSSTSKSWILTSVLPVPYKISPIIVTPTRAPNRFVESTYTALYTFILSLIYLNNGSLPENKLERYMKRVNTDEYTPLEMSLDKLMVRMTKDGYVDKRRDTSSGEEVVEWVVGPRGKVEVGAKGVVGLVKSVYGFGSTGEIGGGDVEGVVKEDEDDLDARLIRSLGIKALNDPDGNGGDGVEVGVNGQADEADEPQQRRRGQPRKEATRNDIDDDNDDD